MLLQINVISLQARRGLTLQMILDFLVVYDWTKCITLELVLGREVTRGDGSKP